MFIKRLLRVLRGNRRAALLALVFGNAVLLVAASFLLRTDYGWILAALAALGIAVSAFVSLAYFRLDFRPETMEPATPIQGSPMAAERIIAGVDAAVQAMQAWAVPHAAGKPHQARDEVARVLEQGLSQRVPQAEIADLAQAIDGNVLEAIAERVEECCKRYLEVLQDSAQYTPRDVDDTTEASRLRIRGELERLRSLNRGVIPSERLRHAWDTCCSEGEPPSPP